MIIHVVSFCILFLNTAGAETLDECMIRVDKLIQENELNQAVEIIEKCLVDYPNSSVVYTKLGSALGRKSGQDFESGNMTEAVKNINRSFEALDKAVMLDSENLEARITYGVMGLEVPEFFGKVKPAVQHLEAARKMLEAQPTDANLDSRLMVYHYLGEGYKRQERFREAEIVWKILLSITDQGEYADAAKKALSEIKSMKSGDEKESTVPVPETNDIETLISKGKSYLNAGKYPEARACFEKVMAIDEKNVEGQLLLIQTLSMDADRDYDERIYDDQDTRTHLAFDVVREMAKGVALDPENVQLKLQYAMTCLYMPFFVGKMDEGIRILEEMGNDKSLSDSLHQEIMFHLGFAHMRKSSAYWAKLVQNDQESEGAQQVYEYYGLRSYGPDNPCEKPHVEISLHLGFMDELAPQTAVWIEDGEGNFVKTVYVSGFAGHAKEKQVTLRKWGESTNFETDGTTGASIDWGTHTFIWDLTRHDGKKVKKGTYKVRMEVSWWPTFRYALADVDVKVGKKSQKIVTKKDPFLPLIKVKYVK